VFFNLVRIGTSGEYGKKKYSHSIVPQLLFITFESLNQFVFNPEESVSMKTFTGQQEVDISECNSITAKKIYL
jgi:hypothetical protein